MAPFSVPPLHNTDLKHLRLFKAVVECGGLSAAEETTGLGASAISKQLSDLETRLGSQLCVRGRGGFQLTPEGLVTYNAVLRLLDAVDEFRDSVSSARSEVSGELSVWLIDNSISMPKNPVATALAEFTRAYPKVSMSINIATPDIVELAVAEKKAAIGITICKSNLESLLYRVVGNEATSMYCGRGHVAFDADEREVRTLMAAGFRYVKRGYLVQENIPQPFVGAPFANSYHVEATLQLLLTGCFVGIVPDHIAAPWIERGDLFRLPLDEYVAERPVFVVIREGSGGRRSVNLMVDLIVEAYRKVTLTT